MRSIAFALLALGLSIGIAHAKDLTGEPSANVANLLGDTALAILKAPAKVECIRIDPIMNPKKEDKEKLHGYSVIGKGKDQDVAFAQRLAAILLSDKTYNFVTAKACEFMPGVVFRVWKEKEHADVLLCFSCDELQVITASPAGKPHSGHEDFDSARPALLKLAKEAFPEDQTIQALKDTK